MIGERSGNQKMECTLEETEIVVLFNEPDVLNLYKHVHELVHVRANMYTTLDLWIYGSKTCVNIGLDCART